mmetsp:Transcript_23807/g.42850  ORF Transcript_23807/g.42850 Transcript_23807/m.42850 type:complete len:121 (+) Transcript_23807:31-393(+)
MALHPTVIAAAFLSTSLISLAPNILLFLFPNYGASSGQDDSGRAMLSLGQALAVGGLIGDVFLHTLPECFAESMGGDDHEEHDHHDHDEHHHHHHCHRTIDIPYLTLRAISATCCAYIYL